MPAVVVVLARKLAELGTGAKAAVAASVVVATLAVAGGAVAVLGMPGGTPGAADLAYGLVQPPEVPSPSGDPAPAEATPADTAVVPPLPTAEAAAGSPPAAAPAPVARSSSAPPGPAAAPPPTASVPTPAAPAPAPSAAVPRRTPSPAEVQQAIEALPNYIKTSIKPTPGLVATIGDQVCTAFDQGRTVAEVKATGLQMLTRLPRTTVLPGGADWAVRTVVALYCPGHASKLV